MSKAQKGASQSSGTPDASASSSGNSTASLDTVSPLESASPLDTASLNMDSSLDTASSSLQVASPFFNMASLSSETPPLNMASPPLETPLSSLQMPPSSSLDPPSPSSHLVSEHVPQPIEVENDATPKPTEIDTILQTPNIIALERDLLGLSPGEFVPRSFLSTISQLQDDIDTWTSAYSLLSCLEGGHLCFNEINHFISTKLNVGGLSRFREIELWRVKSKSAWIISQGLESRFHNILEEASFSNLDIHIILLMRIYYNKLHCLFDILGAEYQLINTAVHFWLQSPSAGVSAILGDVQFFLS
ncbi:hypothetical protein H0H81_000712 [Sphagnurus paluster]|uniref:Uncharacterized protein n=1 Tax=Sphagnurus paluster TaxID=117069 RepID=A0A9P7GGE4_9AGAR|nr:hypothetical protein H0H81_000712 [Sphagnurus paluster]